VFGTGPVGLAVVRELVARGHTVRAVNRGGRAAFPPGVELLAGDAGDPAFACQASAGAGAAVVYDALHGLRCCGLSLAWRAGRLRLGPRYDPAGDVALWPDEGARLADREAWLLPRREGVSRLLRRVEGLSAIVATGARRQARRSRARLWPEALHVKALLSAPQPPWLDRLSEGTRLLTPRRPVRASGT
jgi:hypothetical protein